MSKISELLKINVDFKLKQLNWSRNEFARRMDEPPASVSNWLNGKVAPGADKLEKMADILGIQPEDLLKTSINLESPIPRHSLEDCLSTIRQALTLFSDLQSNLIELAPKDRQWLFDLIRGAVLLDNESKHSILAQVRILTTPSNNQKNKAIK